MVPVAVIPLSDADARAYGQFGLLESTAAVYAAPVLDALTKQLADGLELQPKQIASAVMAMTHPEIPPETKADFLIALARKGETPGEIADFARALRELSVAVPVDPSVREAGLVDVCGTGGDKLGTFNVSTTVALVVASAGLPVAKHGNRAVTSQSGSADVLEALGVPVSLGPAEAAAALRERGFAFFFAPLYHPAFKHIAPARKLCAERGQRTVFNFLGPLLNPARPSAQLVGVPNPALCVPIARALQSLGVQRGLVVSGSAPLEDGTGAWLDEASILGPTTAAEFSPEMGVHEYKLDLRKQFPGAATLAALRGGDKFSNAATVRELLAGQVQDARRGMVVANAALALRLVGRADTVEAGVELAQQLIDSGKVAQLLTRLAAH
jgi:anthranilate phosphoribosyltransferase